MHVSAVFTENYLRPYSCSETNFTAAVKCAYKKTKIESEIIKIEIFEIQIYNLGHNILELYNVLVQIRLTTSKTKRHI